MFNSIFKTNSILITSIILLIVLAVIMTFLIKSNIGAFQKMILMVAIVVLFITLIIIAYSLKQSKNSDNWPPVVPICPDYWVSDGSGNNITCTNVKNLGKCKPSAGSKHLVMNFNNAPYTGANGNCAKYTWANNCGIAWDGLTYGVNNPCT